MILINEGFYQDQSREETHFFSIQNSVSVTQLKRSFIGILPDQPFTAGQITREENQLFEVQNSCHKPIILINEGFSIDQSREETHF